MTPAATTAADPLDEPEHTDTVVNATTTCPNPECGLPVVPGDRYCEGCGHDVTKPFGGATTGELVLVVSADRATWERLAPEGVAFPDDCSPHTVELPPDELSVGRSDPARGTTPDVDVAALTGDPGVSRRHAALCRVVDGTWTVTDLGSANGTWRNDDPAPITPGVAMPFRPGDRVQLGAYTVLELVPRP